jgi:hypothetical protein
MIASDLRTSLHCQGDSDKEKGFITMPAVCNIDGQTFRS